MASVRQRASTTVVVVTAGIDREHVRECFARLKRYTSSIDLMILDNGGGPDFNHGREMNKALAAVTTDFIVFMDDDVYVEAEWLPNLLQAMDDETGIVAPLHRDGNGGVSLSAVYFRGDGTGAHAHLVDVPDTPRECQALCGAIMLVNRATCGHLRVAEDYAKYALDLDYCLSVWEAGAKVVCTPAVTVTHLGGATMPRGSLVSNRLWHQDMELFEERWIASGRLGRIEDETWPKYALTGQLMRITKRIRAIAGAGVIASPIDAFEHEVNDLIAGVGSFRLLAAFLRQSLQSVAETSRRSGDMRRARVCEAASQRLAGPPDASHQDVPLLLYEYDRHNIVQYRGQVFAVPHRVGAVDLTTESGRTQPGILVGKTQAEVRAAMWRSSVRAEPQRTAVAAAPALGFQAFTPRLILEWYRGFNIILFGLKYYAIRQDQGPFDFAALRTDQHRVWCVAGTLEEAQREVDRMLAASAPPPGAVRLPGGQALGKTLVLCTEETDATRACLERLNGEDVTLIGSQAALSQLPELPSMVCPSLAPENPKACNWRELGSDLVKQARALEVDTVVVPYRAGTMHVKGQAEQFAGRVCARLLTWFENGRTRLYAGEDLHRVIYSSAYVRSLLEVVPSLRGRRVLEVGCGDGLICDLVLGEGPASVVGVDVLGAVGCGYHDAGLRYAAMDGGRLGFASGSFDLTYSIATFEHCPDPVRVLQEMKRVTRPGGWCYVQAGPLYFSPFGHHMFEVFDHYPWVHLRLSRDEIVDYCATHGLDAVIARTIGRDPADYVDSMLRSGYLNRKTYAEYGLEAFMAQPDIEVLKHVRSHEGAELLTDVIRRQLPEIPADDLIAHGFELAFQVRG